MNFDDFTEFPEIALSNKLAVSFKNRRTRISLIEQTQDWMLSCIETINDEIWQNKLLQFSSGKIHLGWKTYQQSSIVKGNSRDVLYWFSTFRDCSTFWTCIKFPICLLYMVGKTAKLKKGCIRPLLFSHK